MEIEQVKNKDYFSEEQILAVRARLRKNEQIANKKSKFISHDSINVTGEPGDQPL